MDLRQEGAAARRGDRRDRPRRDVRLRATHQGRDQERARVRPRSGSRDELSRGVRQLLRARRRRPPSGCSRLRTSGRRPRVARLEVVLTARRWIADPPPPHNRTRRLGQPQASRYLTDTATTSTSVRSGRPADPLARLAAPRGRRIQTTVTRRYLDALTGTAPTRAQTGGSRSFVQG